MVNIFMILPAGTRDFGTDIYFMCENVSNKHIYWLIQLDKVPGGKLCYFHIYIGSGHYLGFKLLNFIIFFFLGGGGVQKNEYFGSSQNWTGFRGNFFAILGLFLR